MTEDTVKVTVIVEKPDGSTSTMVAGRVAYVNFQTEPVVESSPPRTLLSPPRIIGYECRLKFEPLRDESGFFYTVKEEPVDGS